VNEVRRVVRIATYVPAFSVEGRPTAGFDEDAFTLGGTAAERVWSDRHDDQGPILLHLIGEFPPAADWGFSAVLGREVAVVRHPPGSLELVKTLRELEAGEGGAALIVAADGRAAVGESPSTKPSTEGAAAVAYLLEPAETTEPFPVGKGSASRSAVAATLRTLEGGKGGGTSVTLVGDWQGRPAGGRTLELSPGTSPVDAGLGVVSEGAYVPRARYLENLPSRWRFLAETCGACHGTTFPARGVCRRCGRKDSLTTIQLPLDGGRVVAITTVGKGGQPTEFDRQVESSGPYDVALVELARGVRVTLQVTDSVPGELRVGARVNTLLRRLYPMEGEWRYGRKAVPAGTAPRTDGKTPPSA